MNTTNLADHTSTVATAEERFSLQLRKGTKGDHSSAEHSSAMTDLMKGELPLDGFVRMQAQVAHVYKALEAAADSLEDDPIAAPFIDERLRRTPFLSRDLDRLGGAGVSDMEPTAATQRYCDRITSIAAEWSPGLVAHHYTRYLGDLSGGQYICRVVERTYGIDATTGSSFFHFNGIDDVEEFKNNYRSMLDAIPLSADEREVFIGEVSTSYALSTEMFLSLDGIV